MIISKDSFISMKAMIRILYIIFLPRFSWFLDHRGFPLANGQGFQPLE